MERDRLKVCLVTGEYPPQIGGLADYTRHLARGLMREGITVGVLTTASASDHQPPQEAPEPEVLATAPRWDFRIFRLARRAVDQLQPDVLHIQYQTGAFGMHPAINLLPRWLAWRRPRVAVVTTFHDLREPYLFPKAGPLRRWATQQLALGSRGVIATNPEDAAILRSWIGGAARRPRLAAVPIGPNILPAEGRPGDPRAIRRAWGIPEDAYLLGHFGMLNRTKGLETAFRALRLLLDQGLPARLVMLGEEVGPTDATNRRYRDELRRLARELGLEGHLVWTDYLPPEELSRALAALDCCLLPYTEGASYRHGALLAALAHGVPVVTTQPHPVSAASAADPGAFPPLEDGVHCRLVPPGDAPALADAARQVLKEATLRRTLAEGGQGLAAHFSWNAIARDTAEFYRQVLGSGGDGSR